MYGDATTFFADVGESGDTALDTLDAGTRVDATHDTTEVVARTDAATDNRDASRTMLDLSTSADGSAGGDASLPTGCVDQDLYVDVLDGQPTTRLIYSGNSAIPLAAGKGIDVSIEVSENPNWGGTIFALYLEITGAQSATTSGVGWTPAGASKSMTDRCGGGHPVTITHFDTGGGILEGNFDTLGVGYSCEGLAAVLSGHFRVCYTPTK
jgi:hypothetical protein